jgi:hypothetical protein
MSVFLDRIALALAASTGWAYSTTAALDPDASAQIHLGVSPETPDRCVVLTTYPGGPEPDSRNGWSYPRLQVRVRGINPLEALQLDADAFAALQMVSGGSGPRDIGGGFWLQDCYALQSQAEPLGQDTQGRDVFVRNYQLAIGAS